MLCISTQTMIKEWQQQIQVALAWSYYSISISTPPGWDASPLQGYIPTLNSPVPMLHLSEERHNKG